MDAILSRYGRELTVLGTAGSRQLKGFLQPLAERQKETPFSVTSLGTVDDRRWILLTREEIRENETVTDGGDTFRAVSCQPVYLGRELSHWWTALRYEKEAAQ
ncbi:MAG: hypothetical protein LKJ80_01980 [Oscillibacter sp.]|nr:hypothetical protein [Oscillibacter sp.]